MKQIKPRQKGESIKGTWYGHKFFLVQKHFNLTQKELSKLIGTNESFLSEIIRGLKKPNALLLSAIVEILGVNGRWLLDKSAIYDDQDNEIVPLESTHQKLSIENKEMRVEVNSLRIELRVQGDIIIKYIGENADLKKQLAEKDKQINDLISKINPQN